MEESSVETIDPALLPDRVTIRHWFAAYGVYLLATAIPLWMLLSSQPWQWTWRPEVIGSQLAHMSAWTKILMFAIYISLCCTFIPLPTSPIVSAVALQSASITGELWSTTLIVATVGALASTIANLNDYHLFTWMLRSKKVAGLKQTKLYQRLAGWFGRSPFFLLTVFSFIPIPIDVIRLLAITYRYPRLPFAAANFIGRFLRYGIIAYITFVLGDKGWLVMGILFGLAVLLGLAKLLKPLAVKIFVR